MKWWVVPDERNITLDSGLSVVERNGSLAGLSILTANLDPAVFGGPNGSAKAFVPGRENADRLLTWVSELRDIRECPSPALGSDALPRNCPGAELAQSIVVQVTTHFLEGIEWQLYTEQAHAFVHKRRSSASGDCNVGGGEGGRSKL